MVRKEIEDFLIKRLKGETIEERDIMEKLSLMIVFGALKRIRVECEVDLLLLLDSSISNIKKVIESLQDGDNKEDASVNWLIKRFGAENLVKYLLTNYNSNENKDLNYQQIHEKLLTKSVVKLIAEMTKEKQKGKIMNCEINTLCELYNLNKEKIIRNEDGTFEYDGDIKVPDYTNTLLRFSEFGLVKVLGNFDCSNCNDLTTLKGIPKEICGDFNCFYCNSLINLKDGPKYIGGNLNCRNCQNLKIEEDDKRFTCGDFLS